MIRYILILCLSVATGAFAYTPFRVTDCSSSTNKLVTYTDLVLYEYPITIPGHVRASGSITINRPVSGHVRLDVTVEKYLLFDYFRLPCVSRVGSCSYDLCELLDWFLSRGCPWQLTASNHFPCVCPFQNGTHSLRPHPFYIGAVQMAWQWIAFGDFRVNGRLVDTRTGEEVGCSTVEFTVQGPAEEEDDFWSSWIW